jgi:hypothetical protein
MSWLAPGLLLPRSALKRLSPSVERERPGVRHSQYNRSPIYRPLFWVCRIWSE